MKGKNQLLVGMAGSFENLTVVQAKDGDAIVKGKIVQMTNPNTEGQQDQRSRFNIARSAASALLAFLNLFFKPSSVMRSSYNEFIAHQFEVQPAGTKWVKKKADGHFNWTKGSLYSLAVEEDTGNAPVDGGTFMTISLIWPYDAGSQIQNGTDQVRYMIKNDETDDYTEGVSAEIRSDGAMEIDVNKPATGLNYLTVFAVDASTGEANTSQPVCSVANDGTIVWRSNFPAIDEI